MTSMGVFGSDRGIIQARAHRVRQFDLSVVVRQQPGFRALQNSEPPALEPRCVTARFDPLAAGFAMHPGSYSPDVENKPNSVVVQELRYTGQQPIKPVVDPAKVAPPPPPERIPQPDLVPSTPPTPEPQIQPPAPSGRRPR